MSCRLPKLPNAQHFNKSPCTDDSIYLDWNQAFDEQSAKVKNAFSRLHHDQMEEMFDEYGMTYDLDELTGAELFQVLKNAGLHDILPPLSIEYDHAIRDDERAALFLLTTGVRGIKALDMISRNGPLESALRAVRMYRRRVTEVSEDIASFRQLIENGKDVSFCSQRLISLNQQKREYEARLGLAEEEAEPKYDYLIFDESLLSEKEKSELVPISQPNPAVTIKTEANPI